MMLRIPNRSAGSVLFAFLLLSASTGTFSQTAAKDSNNVPIPIVPVEKTREETKKTENKDPGTESLVASRVTPVDSAVADLEKLARPTYFRSTSSSENSNFEKMRTDLNAAKKQANNGWQFSFAPYLYATGMHGTVAARGREIEVDMGFGDVLKDFDLGIMGAFEARKGKLSLFSDLMWIKLSDEQETPGGLFNTAKVGVNIFIFDPEVGYQLAGSDKGGLDVVGGVRIWSVETNINVTSGLLPGFDVSQRKSWAAPVFGLRGTYDLTPKLYLSSKFDIGGFGIGADLTTQFYGGLGYRITKHVAIVGGYRYLMVDYDDDEGFKFDTNMNGFLFGAKFTF